VIEPGCGPQLARQLLIRYGRTAEPAPGLKLSREQLGLDVETFAALDTNKDGFLDAAELAKFADRAPDLELNVRVPTGQKAPGQVVVPPAPTPVKPAPAKKPETFKEAFNRLVKKAMQPEEPMAVQVVLGNQPDTGHEAVEVVTPKDRKAPLADAVKTQPGGPLVQLGRTFLDFQPRRETGSGSRFISVAQQPLLQRYLTEFKRLEAAGRGYITEEEAKSSQIFRGVFKLMDRDGDGMLYEKEIRDYLSSMQSLESAAAKACVTLSTSDKGRGLFDLIDKDGDGRLSVREMRQLTKLLELDRDGKGAITRTDVPRNLQVSFQMGSSGGFNGGAVFVVNAGLGGGRPMPQTPRKGPEWFQKMDRNRDGDVSRREFLGTDAQFKEIDTDGDGLISLAEAEAYDLKMREQKNKRNP